MPSDGFERLVMAVSESLPIGVVLDNDENTSYCAPGRYHNTSERPGAKESWVFTGI